VVSDSEVAEAVPMLPTMVGVPIVIGAAYL
jgi:hypothetical protein